MTTTTTLADEEATMADADTTMADANRPLLRADDTVGLDERDHHPARNNHNDGLYQTSQPLQQQQQQQQLPLACPRMIS
jgi:hypothetical protein